MTATTYKRQLTGHILPAFEGLAVEDITTDDVQRLFNSMTGAKTSKDKKDRGRLPPNTNSPGLVWGR